MDPRTNSINDLYQLPLENKINNNNSINMINNNGNDDSKLHITKYHVQRTRMKKSFIFENGEPFIPRSEQKLRQQLLSRQNNMHSNNNNVPNTYDNFTQDNIAQHNIRDSKNSEKFMHNYENKYPIGYNNINKNNVAAHKTFKLTENLNTTFNNTTFNNTLTKDSFNNNQFFDSTNSSNSVNTQNFNNIDNNLISDNKLLTPESSEKSFDFKQMKTQNNNNTTTTSSNIKRNITIKTNHSTTSNHDNKLRNGSHTLRRTNSMGKFMNLFNKLVLNKKDKLSDKDSNDSDSSSLGSSSVTDFNENTLVEPELYETIDVGKDLFTDLDIDQNDNDKNNCKNLLFDSDLIFDSLLLKADKTINNNSNIILNGLNYAKNNGISSINSNKLIQNDIQFINKDNNHQKIIIDNDIDSELEVDMDMDMDLDNDNDVTLLDEPVSNDCFFENFIPPRSDKRPIITNSPSMRLSLILDSYQNNMDHLIQRLELQFDNIILIDAHDQVRPPHYIHCNKQVRFAPDIYVTETWDFSEYPRQNPFFQAEHKSQLNNIQYLETVKRELNQYKSTEMSVHAESQQFTQFFQS